MNAPFRKVVLKPTGRTIAQVRAMMAQRAQYARVADDDALRESAREAARAAMRRIDASLGLPPC